MTYFKLRTAIRTFHIAPFKLNISGVRVQYTLHRIYFKSTFQQEVL